MKRLVLIICCVFMVASMSTPALARKVLSCSDMKKFVKALYDVADYISATKGDFTENTSLERDMDDVISVLEDFAELDGDEALSDAVDDLVDVWEMKRWTGEDVKRFKRAFDATAVALDRVYEKRCE